MLKYPVTRVAHLQRVFISILQQMRRSVYLLYMTLVLVCLVKKSLITWAPLPKVAHKSFFRNFSLNKLERGIALKLSILLLGSLVLDSILHLLLQIAWKYLQRMNRLVKVSAGFLMAVENTKFQQWKTLISKEEQRSF